MTTDQALALTKAWCAEARESFEDHLRVDPNGGFKGVFGAAEVTYDADKRVLHVDGLVNYDASLLVEYPVFFDEVKHVGDRQPYTLGEGQFYLHKQPHKAPAPQLTLRKTFTNGSIAPSRFVAEVDWLMQWSTYWRTQRYLQVGEKDEADLLKEAPGIDASARKNQPRPW